MYLTGQGAVISQRSIVSKKDTSKTYHFLKLIDDNDSELEVICESKVLGLDRFQRVEVIVDVVQGKYPQYKLIDINIIKDKVE